MTWSQVRQVCPNQWLVIEALEAHTTPDKQRNLDKIAIIQNCPDGRAAMQKYRQLHLEYPLREFFFVHTGREKLDIRERRWLGIRRG